MNDPRGFAIVGTVLVLCIVLILVASATALRLAGQLGQGEETRDWQTARLLAEGCADTALAELQRDEGYGGNETVTIGSGTCTIRPVLTSGGVTTIQTEATVDGHPYRIEIDVNADTTDVSSWAHVAGF